MTNAGRPGGNPDIANTPNPGPTTKIGKLRNSVHSVKQSTPNITIINPDSMAAKAVGFNGTKEKLQAYHNFVSFVLEHPIKTLSEIQRMEGLLAVMENNLMNLIKKQEDGESLSDKDRKDMYLMKDTLVDLHKIKYGEKRLNVNASYKDIRDAMFEE